MSTLSNRAALVTGASRGLGRATATLLAKHGARVIVHYGVNRDAADQVVAEIVASGGQADAIGADLASADGPKLLAEAVKALGLEPQRDRRKRRDRRVQSFRGGDHRVLRPALRD